MERGHTALVLLGLASVVVAGSKPQRNCILGSRGVTSCDVTMGLNRLAPVVTRRKTLNFGSRYHGIGM